MTRVYKLIKIGEIALCSATIYNPIGQANPCLMEQKVQEAIATIKNLRLAVSCNTLPYQAAKKLAEPHLKVLNDKAREIAVRHHRKPLLITFTGFRTL
jgi:hypothetical protein